MSVPRLLVAAPSSGSGKTLLTCGLLLALKRRGLRLASFKCGPDYVDPMFHREVLGISAGNLDLFLAGEAVMRRSFDRHAAGCDLALVEGVMGYYDGWSAAELCGSSWDVARVLRAPTVLVVNARGQSLSAVASLLGFLRMREDSGIRGVIFNQMTSRVFEAIRPQVEALGVRALGCLPRDAALALPSRPLGLVPPEELPDLRRRLERLADWVEAGVSLDALLALAQEAAPLGPSPEAATPEIRPRQSAPPRQPVTVAVARDAAFCFHYRDNLELLERLGARLKFFSPLVDPVLPSGTQALLLGGGYSGVYGRCLSENVSMRETIRRALDAGVPCLAEGGGFLYLHESLVDADGVERPMVGAVSARGQARRRTGRFGYVSLEALQDCPYLKDGERVRGHEFHEGDSEAGAAFASVKPDGRRWTGGVVQGGLMAGFAQLYYPSCPQLVERFLAAGAGWNGGCRGV